MSSSHAPHDSAKRGPRVERIGERLVLPGLATAHSHAFQRALRGRTQRRGRAEDSFWSWRDQMYALAEQLDPDVIYALSRMAYAELAMAGVTAVGEFHYVHHQPGGAPYADRLVLADAVIRAARDTGLRIALLRVLYHRAGAGRQAEGAQLRFADAHLASALADVDALASRHASDRGVTVGVAPHSVRAVPREWIREAHGFARERGMAFHMHVCEQRRELEECVAEHGVTPVQLLSDDGVLDEGFVGVHATHLGPGEARALGAAHAFACICRTTERDLGDGHCDAAALVAAGVRLCTGVDSHAVTDPFEEARAIELDDRVRAEARVVAAEPPALLEAATRNGYAAIGMADTWHEDRVALDANDPALVSAGDADALVNAVVFGASPRAVCDVEVAGRVIVEDGRVRDWDGVRAGYEAALREVFGPGVGG